MGEQMGAWAFLPFENDDALDWLDEPEAGGAEVVRGALAKARDDAYVEAPEGNVAIAAAESRQLPKATLQVICQRTWRHG